jgi:hypothetical protein
MTPRFQFLIRKKLLGWSPARERGIRRYTRGQPGVPEVNPVRQPNSCGGRGGVGGEKEERGLMTEAAEGGISSSWRAVQRTGGLEAAE